MTIDKDKKDKILQLKRINDKYIEKYRLLKRGRDHLNYFRYYLLPINKDLTYEEGELENEIYAQEKKIRKEEERSREREEEREQRRRELAEKREREKPVFLKRCLKCRDTCLFCKGQISFSQGNHGWGRDIDYYKAHGTCMPNNDNCCICYNRKGTTKCSNICYPCHQKLKFIEKKCYYCKKNLYKKN